MTKARNIDLDARLTSTAARRDVSGLDKALALYMDRHGRAFDIHEEARNETKVQVSLCDVYSGYSCGQDVVTATHFSSVGSHRWYPLDDRAHEVFDAEESTYPLA